MRRETSERLQSGMTVQQLIEELKYFDANAIVVFRIGYGDRINTQQALPVQSVDNLDIEFEQVRESAYSNSGLAIKEVNERRDNDPDYDPDDHPEVVVLS